MIKADPYTTTSKPNGCEFYVFGSATRSYRARDLDILVVYDKNAIPANKVRTHCQQLIAELENLTSLAVDVTFLSKEEECEHEFIVRSKAVLIEDEIIRITTKFGRSKETD